MEQDVHVADQEVHETALDTLADGHKVLVTLDDGPDHDVEGDTLADGPEHTFEQDVHLVD